MNTLFSVKRFRLLEQYKRQETGRQFLWMGAIILGICILCMLYDINRGGIYYSKHTGGSNLSNYMLLLYYVAPCLLEANINKRNSISDLLLPASSFEKFLYLWLKYIILLPLFGTLILLCLKGILSVAFFSYLKHFGADITFYEIRKDQIFTYALLQGSFFIGFFLFQKHLLVKSFILFCFCFIVCMGVIVLLSLSLPVEREGFWISNMVSYPTYNFPVSSTSAFIIVCLNYSTPVLFLIGSWISGYFLYKEKQL